MLDIFWCSVKERVVQCITSVIYPAPGFVGQVVLLAVMTQKFLKDKFLTWSQTACVQDVQKVAMNVARVLTLANRYVKPALHRCPLSLQSKLVLRARHVVDFLPFESSPVRWPCEHMHLVSACQPLMDNADIQETIIGILCIDLELHATRMEGKLLLCATCLGRETCFAHMLWKQVHNNLQHLLRSGLCGIA